MGTIRNIVTHLMAKHATLLGSPEYHENALCDLGLKVKVKFNITNEFPYMTSY